ncbi:3-oxoacyl-[acyl-carrier-protein] synthase III C-terminal domain-containing protein [Chloroflexota bacterium]
MVGITAYGAYVPFYRLSKEAIAKAWDGFAPPGEKAVANFDEDSITMAVEAAIDCIGGLDRGIIDALFFASTTAPYKEKQAAALAAFALDLRRDIVTQDYANSLRAGTAAMRSAIDAVKAGSAGRVLVTASDCRLGAPQSTLEQNLGDGAAALMIGDSGVAVSIEGSYSIANEFIDLWRLENDRFVRSWEERFIMTQGYEKVLPEAVLGAMKKYDLTPKDFAKVIFYAPDARSHTRMAARLGFDPRTQLQDPLFDVMGNTGAAFPLMMLVAALEEAKPGDRLLLASYGDGSDVLVLQATEEIAKVKPRRGMKGHLASKSMLRSYEKYVLFRRLMPVEPARRPEAYSAAPTIWRDAKSLLALNGSKCKSCSRVQYPVARICPYCGSKDEFDYARLSDKKGKIVSFNEDFVATTIDPPNMMTQVDFDGGGRIQCAMTDRVVEDVKVDMPVEMTLRRIHDGRDILNYTWKPRPIR